MPAQTCSVGLTETYTEDKVGIGFEFTEFHPTYGERVWVWVKNGENSNAFVKGTIVGRKDGEVTKIGTIAATSSDPARVMGVAQHPIAAGSYGFILRKGVGYVLADTGGISANTGIIPGNAVAGRADSSGGVTAASFGWAHAAISATDVGLATFDCRG